MQQGTARSLMSFHISSNDEHYSWPESTLMKHIFEDTNLNKPFWWKESISSDFVLSIACRVTSDTHSFTAYLKSFASGTTLVSNQLSQFPEHTIYTNLLYLRTKFRLLVPT